MAAFNPRELRAWAVKGAESRLLEIAAEAAAIYRAFPELREGGGSVQAPQAVRAEPGNGAAPAPRRREMSPEARERIAAAQRKRWAALREARTTGTEIRSGSAKAATGRSDKKR